MTLPPLAVTLALVVLASMLGTLFGVTGRAMLASLVTREQLLQANAQVMACTTT